MRSLIRIFLAATVLAIGNSSLHAAFVFAGNHLLLANQANQVINIFASSATGEVAPGFNLNIVVDDGGSVGGLNPGGVDGNSPRITSINLKPVGGLFAGIPDAQNDVFSSQKLFQVTIAPSNAANRPVITTNFLLAQVTLNTTGLASGNWVLNLSGLPALGIPPSDFAGLATTVTNGSVSITAVPEPSSLLALSFVGGFAAVSRYRRRSRKY